MNPLGKTAFKKYFDSGTWPAGLYTTTLKIYSNGDLLSVDSADFEIISSLEQANALSGTFSVNPSRIFETEGTTINYSVLNIGNEIDLPIIQVNILVVDPDTEQVVRSISSETSLNGREIYSDSIQFDSTGLPPKPYLLVLQGITSGITQTIGGAGLQIDEIPNTAPISVAGSHQNAFAGQPVMLDGTGSHDPDSEPLNFNWYFISVPDTSALTTESLDNSVTAMPSFIPDAEGIYVVGLMVNDGLADSPEDTVSIFVNPAPKVDVHPETINLKSNGGAKSVTGVLSSPVLTSFEYLTQDDGITVSAIFELENRYTDKDGNVITFMIPAEDHRSDDLVVASDTDGDGEIDQYKLTLKFNRDLLIAGFTDDNGELMITDTTELVSTVIADGMRVGSDINTVLSPPKGKK